MMTRTAAPTEEVAYMPPGTAWGLPQETNAERRVRIESDPTYTPEMKRWFLDETIWSPAQQGAHLGLVGQGLVMMRSTRGQRDRHGPHPMILPETDEIVGVVAGVPAPGVQAGKIREWAVWRGTHQMNPETGVLTRVGLLPSGQRKHETWAPVRQRPRPRKTK